MPVIDRGPYANNASWDLTIATSNALNFTSVGSTASAPYPRGRPAPLS